MFQTKRFLTSCLALVAIATVSFLVRAGDATADEDCAPYISGGPDNPVSGSLRGTRTVSVTIGINSVGIVTVTVTVTIGVYDTGDGDMEVRCDTYEEWTGPNAVQPRQ